MTAEPSWTGEALCLGAAALWAVSVNLYHGPIREFGARGVNLTKCVLAALLQGLTVWVFGQQSQLGQTAPATLLALAASGLIGLSLGDTALFGAVARIGPQRTLLLQTLSPLFAALFAWPWAGELPAPEDAAAALVILAGVAVVVAPEHRAFPGRDGPAAASWPGVGIALGALAAACQGAGVVLAKTGATELPAVAASAVRLVAAAAGLVVLGAATGSLGRVRELARTPSALGRVVPAMLLGTYLALFAMLAGIARAPASIAAVLLSTSPVFALFLEAKLQHRRIRPRAMLGTLLAIMGVAWLVVG